MAQGGRVLADVLFAVLKEAKPGVSELELDRMAEKLIREKGGEPGFKKVPGYKHTICVSTNNVVVHGIPTAYKLKEGDVLGIDCGVYFEGFHTDMAETIRVVRGPVRSSFPAFAEATAGRPASAAVPREALRSGVWSPPASVTPNIGLFLETGKQALEEAIKVARAGNRIGHISKTIQDIVEGGGYSVVRSLIGHGVGVSLHEEPEVPGFLSRPIEKTPELVAGMTIAIEVIYNMGKKDVIYANRDGWTIKTADNSLSGLFERTVAIDRDGPRILTA